MSGQLFVRPEVEADIAEAEAWYEERQEGLGKEFTRTVRDALRELPVNALIYRLRHRRLGVRWFYLKTVCWGSTMPASSAGERRGADHCRGVATARLHGGGFGGAAQG